MKATSQLKKEHIAVKKMLEIINALNVRLKNEEEIKISDYEKILDFLRIFVDKCHHGKEEGILFPFLESKGMSSKNGPIGVMLYEHTAGRELIKKISESVESYKNGDRNSAERIIDYMEKYIYLLQNHIMKEDNVLFKITDEMINEAEQDILYDKFEVLEENEIGKGKHEELHKLMEELSEKYL